MKKKTEKTENANPKKGVFNKENIDNAKAKADAFVVEVKKFISVMGFMDWLLLVVALSLGFATVASLFGPDGSAFIKTGEKVIKKLKALGFWKAMGLLFLIVVASGRAVKVVRKYKIANHKDAETKGDETKDNANAKDEEVK